MVTLQHIKFAVVSLLGVAFVSHLQKELDEFENPETRKKLYYSQLKNEGFYQKVNPRLRNRPLDEEDKEALRKYAS